ncbi:TMS membrane protein/tumor differentially expressed protein [Hanseniaspora valbyensis NRRL Y-1626]|uniref:TMS membrane protein/tumor differentially expressed protein n=1 Tax=Hanseniaspora valbyensis NRRL Y-1626 TaxID=766949 RepID=A0A1B7T9Q2_9ASCO|nr:TMS membrane protein/tumor differentially expressed protein [Hanseniaspora valbyensis NRRL Y-1626]
MGAIISVPLNAAVTFSTSFLGATASSMVKSAVSNLQTSSLGARILYAIGLLLNSILSWISLSTNHTLWNPLKTCLSGIECGVSTVYRLNFTLGVYHILLMFILLGVKDENFKLQTTIQNSYWGSKIILYFVLLFISFKWVGNDFLLWFSKFVSLPSGSIFVFIGLVLLIDFAHEYTETCLKHIKEEEENIDFADEESLTLKFWRRILIGGTIGMYACTLIMIIIEFVIFCKNHCGMNIFAWAVNIVFLLGTAIMSIHPVIQEYNPKSGLSQASVVAIYSTYLVFSAMAGEPDDKNCNPLVRSTGTRRASIILGSIFTIAAIVYTTLRAAGNSIFNLQDDNAKNEIYLEENNYDDTADAAERREMRRQAIQSAIDEGSLPESALDEYIVDEEEEIIKARQEKPNYNYILFHVIFFLATQWISMLLTINVKQLDNGDFIPVGRTYFYSWVKIISSWLCYILYGWSLIAPCIMEENFDYNI